MTSGADSEQRRLAANLFNQTWKLLEQQDRTPEETDRLIHIAHASRFHWGEVGTNAHLARGEWMCSRVYVSVGRPEAALHHARRCLAYVDAHPDEMEDWDLPYAHEALARSYALSDDVEAARRHAAEARRLAESVAGDEERELLFRDLATLPVSGSERPAARPPPRRSL